ncbi:MAG: hypothetical protein R6V00_12755 [Candidatus Aminicenantes bacterium]
MSQKGKEEETLISWKEIASYLGCRIRTCQRWEKESGLPVYRFLESSKSRVFAYKHELDDWMKPKSQSRPKNTGKYIAILIPPAVLVLIYFAFIKSPSLSQPHDFGIEGSELVILDKNDHELGRFDTGLNNLQNEEFYRDHFQFKRPTKIHSKLELPLIMIQDIDNDSQKEVLFSPITTIQKNTGKLFCLSDKGEVKWMFNVRKEIVFGQKPYTLNYIRGFTVSDILGDELLEVIVIAEAGFMFPTQVVILDHKGKPLKEYWNSGRMTDFSFYDLDKDGQKEIILAGRNNEYDKGCLIVLESDFKTGGSPQTGYYKSPELKQGVEKYYIILPNTKVGTKNFARDPLGRIHIIDEGTISAESYSGIFFEFDFDLKLKEIRFSDLYENFHNEAYQEGWVKEEFSPKVMEKLKSELMSEVLYYTGENWANR